MSAQTVLQRMDETVDAYCKRNRFQQEELTPGRARSFVMQHRLNTRQRNSVLKLRVATNCPDWDTRMKILKACSQEVIGDHEFGGGKPHWQMMEELGVAIGLDRGEIVNAKPLPTTEIAWAAWEGLMSNRHWLEGIVANACAERANVPGYGRGARASTAIHGPNAIAGKSSSTSTIGSSNSGTSMKWPISITSNLAWEAVANYAERLQMENEVIHACEINLRVWELYWHGICDAGALPGA